MITPTSFWKNFGEVFSLLGLLIMLGSGLVSLVLGVLMFLIWLKSGEWHLLVISDATGSLGISIPPIQWVGVQRIVDWFLSWPLILGVLLVGLAVGRFVFVFGAGLQEEAEKLRREKEGHRKALERD